MFYVLPEKKGVIASSTFTCTLCLEF